MGGGHPGGTGKPRLDGVEHEAVFQGNSCFQIVLALLVGICSKREKVQPNSSNRLIKTLLLLSLV